MISKTKIKEAMREHNINNKILAERIGVSPSMITRYLNNESEISATNLCKIAYALQVSVDFLCGKEGSGTISIVGLTEDQTKIVQNLTSAFRSHNAAINKKLSTEQYELLGQIVAEFFK